MAATEEQKAIIIQNFTEARAEVNAAHADLKAALAGPSKAKANLAKARATLAEVKATAVELGIQLPRAKKEEQSADA